MDPQTIAQIAALLMDTLAKFRPAETAPVTPVTLSRPSHAQDGGGVVPSFDSLVLRAQSFERRSLTEQQLAVWRRIDQSVTTVETSDGERFVVGGEIKPAEYPVPEEVSRTLGLLRGCASMLCPACDIDGPLYKWVPLPELEEVARRLRPNLLSVAIDGSLFVVGPGIFMSEHFDGDVKEESAAELFVRAVADWRARAQLVREAAGLEEEIRRREA